jgi:hypothetical protein
MIAGSARGMDALALQKAAARCKQPTYRLGKP